MLDCTVFIQDFADLGRVSGVPSNFVDIYLLQLLRLQPVSFNDVILYLRKKWRAG